MNRAILIIFFCFAVVAQSFGQTNESQRDTAHFEAPVTIVTGYPLHPTQSIAPVALIPRSEIKALATTQDVPKIVSIQPSTIFYSESGTDVGYTHVSLRGFDQRRISILVNGVPQNDAEDQDVYWVDIPGLAASASSIDIERGGASSFYGPPAIGGSINVVTTPSPLRSMVVEAGYGDYNTRSYSVEANSGLILDKYIIHARLAQLHTDGYRRSSWMDRTPYFLSLVRYDSNITTELNFYGGPFSDGLSYYGISRDQLYGSDSARRTNLSETWTYERRPEEGESFSQPHYEMLSDWQIDSSFKLSTTLYSIRGDGQFTLDGTWPAAAYGISNAEYYRLTPVYASRYGFTPILATDTSFARQIYSAYVSNSQWGWLPKLDWKHDGGTLTLAGEFSWHQSLHWGVLDKATELPADLPGDYHFYQYRGSKDIANVSLLEDFRKIEGVRATASVQLVNESYRLYDEKPFYVDSAMALLRQVNPGWTSYDFTVPFTFLNPRLGVNVQLGYGLSAFGSIAYTSREPRLPDYYNAEFLSEPNFSLDGHGGYDFSQPLVHPEHLTDIELGIESQAVQLGGDHSISGRVNFYDMSFSDEIVKSGQLDHFGSPVELNAKSTEHYGLELQLRYKWDQWLSADLGAGFSHNEILDLDTALLGVSSAVIGNAPPGFPSTLLNGSLSSQPFPWLRIDLIGRYVGALYGDLLNSPSSRLDPYFVSDGVVTIHLDGAMGAGFIEAKLQVNNIFNRNYAAMVTDEGYFPGAPRNLFGTISIGL